jgi:hypothetical protein
MVTMKREIAVAAVLATGCLSVPPYKPEALVSFTETGTKPGTGGTVAGPGFALHFADGAGFHFPDALMIDDVDVMGHDPAPGCSGQNEAGLLVSPSSRISADGDAPPVTNRLVPVLRGPAVVKVKLEWATRLDCMVDRTPGGTATFTVFPDGHIVRYDTILDPIKTAISPSECACGMQGNVQFNVVAYWTFAGASFSKIYVPDDAEKVKDLPTPDLIANHEISCLGGPARQVAFAWPVATDSEISSSSAVVRFGRTLSAVGASMLDDFAFDNRSAIFIEHASDDAAGCMAARTRAEEYIKPPHLLINNEIEVSPALDGIYGGGEDGGYVQPGVPVSGRVELTGAVKSPFAVWLRFPSAVDALRVTRDGATVKGPWYLPQRVDDQSWIVWFVDGIAATQKITIDPS